MAKSKLSTLIRSYLTKNAVSQILDFEEFSKFYDTKLPEMRILFNEDVQYLVLLLLEYSSKNDIETSKTVWKEIENSINEEYPDKKFTASIDENIKKKSELLNILKVLRADKKIISNAENHFLIINLIIVLQTKSYPRVTISSFSDLLSLIEFFNKNLMDNLNGSGKNYWFRGQTNYNWNLIPSIYRGIDRQTSHVVEKCRYFDNGEIYGEQYNPKTFFGKYSHIFKGKDFGYDFISYMQHSISYSPLLDFTNNFIISLSFAICNKHMINDFANQDSAIYILIPSKTDNYIKPDNYDNIVNSYKVGIYADKMKSTDFLMLFEKMGKIYSRNPKIHFLDSETNDRMKYQSGKFILYDDFFLYNKDSVPVDNETIIIKIKISKKIKPEIYEYLIRTFPEYEIDNLLDPYRFFMK